MSDQKQTIFGEMSRQARVLVFVMALLFLVGQIAGFVLNIWGFPSQWF